MKAPSALNLIAYRYAYGPYKRADEKQLCSQKNEIKRSIELDKSNRYTVAKFYNQIFLTAVNKRVFNFESNLTISTTIF